MSEELKKEAKDKLEKWLNCRDSRWRWGGEGTLLSGLIIGINPDYDYEEELELEKEYQKSLIELKNNK